MPIAQGTDNPPRPETYQTGSRFFTGKNESTGAMYGVPALARMVSAVVPSALNAAKRISDNAKTNAARPKLICLRMSASEFVDAGTRLG